MGIWKNDEELFSLMKKELFSAVIGDVLDAMERYHQFLPPYLKPLEDSMVAAGRAMTVLETDTVQKEYKGKNPVLAQPFGLMLDALDDLKEHEIYLCTGASLRYALWGELMSTRAKKLGAAGAVLNGYSRDTKGILQQNFPTFSLGRYAQDQAPRGKVIDYRVPLDIDGVFIEPGDIVFGDLDGVVVVPKSIEKEVVERALEKARGEKEVEKSIKNGMTAKAAFEKHGIM